MGVPLVSRDRGGTGGDPELTTVQAFAERYRVDSSVVRGWIKRGQVPYVMVGPRKMRRIPGRTAEPVPPSQLSTKVLQSRDQLISHLVVHNEMTVEIAREIVNSMSTEEVETMMGEFING